MLSEVMRPRVVVSDAVAIEAVTLVRCVRLSTNRSAWLPLAHFRALVWDPSRVDDHDRDVIEATGDVIEATVSDGAPRQFISIREALQETAA